jgi:hypothetical protein
MFISTALMRSLLTFPTQRKRVSQHYNKLSKIYSYFIASKAVQLHAMVELGGEEL